MDQLSPLAARATHHAVFRMATRHGLKLNDDLIATVMTMVALGRLRRIASASDLRAAYDEGAVFTHVLDGAAQRWHVRVADEWFDFIIEGSVIITVLPKATTSKKYQKAQRQIRRPRDVSQIDEAAYCDAV